MKIPVRDIMRTAFEKGLPVPAFNIPHLPMMEPVVAALRETRTFGLVAVARLEWTKFHAQSPAAVRKEYERVKDEAFTRLHLDHVPVIDEDNERVDYESILREALDLGYDSVMIDGSRLPLEENIQATRAAVQMAHEAGAPAEAELGAVLGHEEGPVPPYEELFQSGRGFTDPQEALQFVRETGVDWLSVAIGNIHGAVSATRRNNQKVSARLSIEHLDRIRSLTDLPLVLHGGSGIRRESILDGIAHGIAKINIGTTIRQAYERAVETSEDAGRNAVYQVVTELVRDELGCAGSADRIASAHAS